MKPVLLAAACAAALATTVLAAPVAVKPYVAAAVADPGRAADKDADARRHIAEVISFSGVKPGDKVVDLIPGSGYFTKVFSKVVGPRGHVYMIWPYEYAKEAQPDPVRNADLAKTGYPNTSVIQQPGAKFETPEPVDLVFTVQNYHDYPDKFMGPTDLAILNAAVFAVLKPGGVYVIVDHSAEPGSGLRDTDTLHRIDEATVKQQVLAAGFEYVGESDVLRNKADDRTANVFNPAIRGRTDQFVYKFRKPLK